jgi:hypothetical protein
MTCKVTLMGLALGLTAIALATAALGFAANGQAPAVRIRDVRPAAIVITAAHDEPGRIYCYNGLKGEQTNLYRGWTCVQRSDAELSH